MVFDKLNGGCYIINRAPKPWRKDEALLPDSGNLPTDNARSNATASSRPISAGKAAALLKIAEGQSVKEVARNDFLRPHKEDTVRG